LRPVEKSNSARVRKGRSNINGPDTSERFTFDVAGLSTSGLWTQASQPVAVSAIAHGAGAGMGHPFMAGVAEELAAAGVSVFRFNFPYMETRRRVPDGTPVLLETWNAAIRQIVRPGHGLPIIVGGKSMGGRVASMLAAARGENFPGAALVFFGYPLHAPGNPDRLRDAHLPQIRVPMLFVQGTRDALARFDLVEALVKRLHPLARLHAVTGGDHSFRVKGVKCSDRENGQGVGRIAADYIREIVAGPTRRTS
jgi:predicted alpha/beta-hydrolase family hydrolase